MIIQVFLIIYIMLIEFQNLISDHFYILSNHCNRIHLIQNNYIDYLSIKVSLLFLLSYPFVQVKILVSNIVCFIGN